MFHAESNGLVRWFAQPGKQAGGVLYYYFLHQAQRVFNLILCFTLFVSVPSPFRPFGLDQV